MADYDDSCVMSRQMMNYVKWKYKAQRSRQLVVISAILLVGSALGILFFVLLITGVIPTVNTTSSSKTDITRDDFGYTQDGEQVHRFTFKNPAGTQMQVITLGCILTALSVVDNKGHFDDIVLGFENMQDYEGFDNSQFGSIKGRDAGKIGEREGWSKVVWNATEDNGKVTFSHISPDGDQDFPGEIYVNVTLELTEDNEIIISYSAVATGKASPINLSSRPFFNLAGEGKGTIHGYEINIFADYYLQAEDDRSIILTGDITKVDSTLFDLRSAKPLSEAIFQKISGGYFCLQGPSGKRLAARVHHTDSGRMLDVYTDQPVIQLDTANAMNVSNAKHGHNYSSYSGFCLSTQNYPDDVSQNIFTDNILRPGSTYLHTTWYHFTTQT